MERTGVWYTAQIEILSWHESNTEMFKEKLPSSLCQHHVNYMSLQQTLFISRMIFDCSIEGLKSNSQIKVCHSAEATNTA